jgi:hypothetical protein
MNKQDHWNAIYSTKGEQGVSWFEALPAVSLEMIEGAGLTSQTCGYWTCPATLFVTLRDASERLRESCRGSKPTSLALGR